MPHIGPLPPLTVTNCTFAFNSASAAGGAICTSTSAQNVVLNQVIFTSNFAGGDGGAIDAEDGAATQLQLTQCNFDSNHTNNGSGGAVHTTDQFTDKNSTYTNNYSQQDGGAIDWETPPFFAGALDPLNVSYDTFASNQAAEGGGMFILANAGQNARVNQRIWGCLFNNNQAWDNNGQNTAPFEGGGLFAAEGNSGTGTTTLYVYNSTFYQNKAEDNSVDAGNGGGIAMLVNAGGTGDNITKLFSLTIYDNSTAIDGGGLYVDPNSKFDALNKAVPALLNNIIAGNHYGTSDFAEGPDIFGSVFTSGNNLVGVTNGATVVNNGGSWQIQNKLVDIVGDLASPQDAGLDPNGLVNNGGPTLTIKPMDGSKALDPNGTNINNLQIKGGQGQLDQRGFKRVKQTIGAYDPGANAVQQGQSSTTVVSSVNPSQVGQPVTFTAEVLTDAGTATGTVTFYDGDNELGTVALDDNGDAALTIAALALGDHNITATYSGDDDSAASSASMTQSVVKATSDTTITSSNNPALPDQPVTLTATVTPALNDDILTPSGSVTFMDGDTVLGTVSLADGTASITTSTLTLGSHNITATYDGDVVFLGSSGSLAQVISEENISSVALTSSDNPFTPGQSVTFTATVSGGDTTPTGSVTFLDGDTVLGTAALDSNGVANLTTTLTNLGDQTITAVYGGDAIYDNSAAFLTQTVALAGTGVSLSADNSPSVLKQAVTFTANVFSDGTATGSVTFYDGNNVIGNAGVDADGNALFTTSTLTLGTHDITAICSGDDSHASSSASMTQKVALGTTDMLLSSDGPSQPGDPVTFTATVINLNGGDDLPTGTVTFYDGTTVLGSAALSAVNDQAQATFVASFDTEGYHNITGIYSGDDTCAGTSIFVLQEVGDPTNSPEMMMLNSSLPISSLPGQAVTFTASLIGETPTGNITFYDGTTVIGVAPVNADGTATFTTSTLAVGVHNITLIYSGDDTFASCFNAITQTVALGETNTYLSADNNKTAVGQAVTFTATVGGNDPPPTGNVTFYDGTTVLGSASLDSNGNATFITSTLTLGDHDITAIYAGDGSKLAGSASSLSQSVILNATTTTVTADVNPSPQGQTVTFTAIVAGGDADGRTPTGSVNFYDGTTLLGSGTLALVDGQMQATFTTTLPLGLGAHLIVAVYSGDSIFANSATSWSQSIVSPATTTSLTADVNPSPQGQPVTFTATVAAVDPNAGTPSGSVDFYDGSTYLGSGTLSLVDGQMQATLTTAALSLGDHTTQATYSGDGTFTASSGSLDETIGS